jgi:hypothetical protein
MGEERNACMLLVRNLERKRPLGRPRRRWVDNTKLDNEETGGGSMHRTPLVQKRDVGRALVNAVMNFWGTQNSGKFMSGCTSGGPSSSAQLHMILSMGVCHTEVDDTPCGSC